MNFIMNEKYALITGSNRGLGKAIMKELASSGINIWAHARKETPEFLQLMDEIRETYKVDVCPVYFDMTDEEGMKAAVRQIHSSKKPVRNKEYDRKCWSSYHKCDTCRPVRRAR